MGIERVNMGVEFTVLMKWLGKLKGAMTNGPFLEVLLRIV